MNNNNVNVCARNEDGARMVVCGVRKWAAGRQAGLRQRRMCLLTNAKGDEVWLLMRAGERAEVTEMGFERSRGMVVDECKGDEVWLLMRAEKQVGAKEKKRGC